MSQSGMDIEVKPEAAVGVLERPERATYTSLAVVCSAAGVDNALAVVHATMPDVDRSVLEDIFPVVLGARSLENLTHLYTVHAHDAYTAPRLFLNVDLLVAMLRSRSYGTEQLGVLATSRAGILHRGVTSQGLSRFACTTPRCSYAEDDDSYSQEPAFRLIFSDGTIIVPDHGACLNCIDDHRRSDEEMDY